MISANEALNKLKEGNKRFYTNTATHPYVKKAKQAELLNSQEPYAVVITCSDSRVPVEIIFDAGIGDIFVIRTAGNVLSPENLGSVEYALSQLHTKLVVILGHDDCGAVKSALDVYHTHSQNEISDNLNCLLSHIYPVVEKLDPNDPDIVEKAITDNIKYQLDYLQRENYIEAKIKEGITVIGAKYCLKSGEVSFLK